MSDTIHPLEYVSIDDLIGELRRRAGCLFVAMRPLADEREYTAVIAMGVDGAKVVTATDRDRCLGLAYQAMAYAIPQDVGTGDAKEGSNR